jgi:hypothetical protein
MKEVVITLAIFCSIAVLLFAPKDFKSNDISFDSVEWKKGGARTRGQMIHDLTRQEILIGMSRAQVEATLGRPDQDHKSFIKYAVDTGSIWERWMIRNNYMIEFHSEDDSVISANFVDA